MKASSKKNAAPVSEAPARLDSTKEQGMSNPIVPEIDPSSTGSHKTRPVIAVYIRHEKEPGTTIDVRIGKWWFGLGLSFWFDIAREQDGDIVPVFPRGQGDE